ncbi:protein D2-like [Plodia interpunctella]|uniref:protein D2-like n=1 Tax=Plodia interpunctella TaxID=58824 RepID=UPI002368D0E9|nr:protein D2-like [Plodia interpunctella]
MYLICAFLLVTIVFESQIASGRHKDMKSFMVYEVVSDVISNPPQNLLRVMYPSGVEVAEGKELKVDDVIGYPVLTWNAEEDEFYTVMLVDPDYPSRREPYARSFVHWLKMNVVLDDVTTGDTVADLIFTKPDPGTGIHRYVYLVYKQPAKISSLHDNAPNSTTEGRKFFNPNKFASKYNLGQPVAGNFYRTRNKGRIRIYNFFDPAIVGARTDLTSND